MKLSKIVSLCLLPALAGAAQLPTASNAPGGRVLELLDLVQGSVQLLTLPDSAGEPFEVLVELDGERRLLRLTPRSLRAEGFQLLVEDSAGSLAPTAPAPPATYRGDVLGLPESRVAASLVDGQLSALVRTAPAEPLWFVQPLLKVLPGVSRGWHAVYAEGDMSPSSGTCEVYKPEPAAHAPGGLGLQSGSALKVCQIACDADFEFYKKHESSVGLAGHDIENVLNSVALIYQGDAGVIDEITTIIIRTSQADPYSSTSAGSLLSQFRSHWNGNHGNIQRDVAHLFTGKELNGSTIGVAYLGVVCNKSNAYGLSQSLFSPSAGQRVALTAHELGHNWSASHCDGQSDCKIMCSGLGGCVGLSQFGGSATSQIVGYKNSAGCLSAQLAPSLSSLSPRQVQPVDETKVTLTGASFLGTDRVQVGAASLGTGQFTLINDHSLFFKSPTPTSLGGVQVVVHSDAGASNPLTLEYVPTSPPQLTAVFGVSVGESFGWEFAGGPGELGLLLVSLSSATLPLLGTDVLAAGLLLHDQTLDAVGLGGFSLPVPPLALGTLIYSQLLTLNGALTLAGSEVGITVITF